jgi:hypothetical protein
LEPSPRTPDLIAEIKRVMKFQRALFSGESSDPETRKLLATALGRGVFPSPLRVAWWRGF